MKIKASDTVRVYRTGGGGPYLFISIPMMAMGAYLFYLGVAELTHNREPIPSIVFLIIGTIFLLIGTLLTLFRAGVTLDRIQGTASQWRKIFRHKTNAVHYLREFSSIQLFIHRSAKRTGHIVQLAGESKKLILCDLLNLEAAKQCADDASSFLSLPVVDSASEV